MDKKTKKIDFEYTKAYFEMFFRTNPDLIAGILKFLETDKKNYQLNKDEWTSFYDFMEQLGKKFPTGYDLGSAWTLVLDEYYIKYCKANKIALPEGYGDEDEI